MYQDEPRFAERFGWHVWRWQHDRDVTRSGDGTEEPRWANAEELAPPAPLAEGERERTTQTETFGATVQSEDGTYEIAVPTLLDYRTLERTEQWWVVPLDGGMARLAKPVSTFGG